MVIHELLVQGQCLLLLGLRTWQGGGLLPDRCFREFDFQISDNGIFFFAETEKLNGSRAQLGHSGREHSDYLLEATECLGELGLQSRYQGSLTP